MTKGLLTILGGIFVLYGLFDVAFEAKLLLNSWNYYPISTDTVGNVQELSDSKTPDQVQLVRKTLSDIGRGMITLAMGAIMLGMAKIIKEL